MLTPQYETPIGRFSIELGAIVGGYLLYFQPTGGQRRTVSLFDSREAAELAVSTQRTGVTEWDTHQILPSSDFYFWTT
jgi:hypothetical protein